MCFLDGRAKDMPKRIEMIVKPKVLVATPLSENIKFRTNRGLTFKRVIGRNFLEGMLLLELETESFLESLNVRSLNFGGIVVVPAASLIKAQ